MNQELNECAAPQKSIVPKHAKGSGEEGGMTVNEIKTIKNGCIKNNLFAILSIKH